MSVGMRHYFIEIIFSVNTRGMPGLLNPDLSSFQLGVILELIKIDK